jgi:hypothetical protein
MSFTFSVLAASRAAGIFNAAFIFSSTAARAARALVISSSVAAI